MRREMRGERRRGRHGGELGRVGLSLCLGRISASVAKRQVTVHITADRTVLRKNQLTAAFRKPISLSQQPFRQLQWRNE